MQGINFLFLWSWRGCRGSDSMVVGFTATYAISAYHLKRFEFESCHGEVYSIQHYVIKFVVDLRQVGGLLRFPSPINKGLYMHIVTLETQLVDLEFYSVVLRSPKNKTNYIRIKFLWHISTTRASYQMLKYERSFSLIYSILINQLKSL